MLVGLGLFLTGSGISQQATQQAVIDDPLGPSTTTALATLAQDSTGTAGEHTADGASDTETTDALDGVDDPRPGDSANTTTSGGPPSLDATDVAAPTSTTEPLDLLAPERRPTATPDHDGVYGMIGGPRLERLAGLVVVDGLVFTTGAAVDGRPEVALGGPEGWTTATVLGTDPVTDVAVLTVTDPTYLDHTRALAPEPGERWLGTGGPELGNRVALATGDGQLPGIITATGQPATVDSGRMIYGVLRTSIPHQHDAHGAGLIDVKGGHLIGLVIDSDDPLVSAIPVDVLRGIGESFLAVGQPAIEWLGIRGSIHSEGGVIITEIIPAGPAEGAGLVAGEVIVKVDGQLVDGMNHLAHLIRQAGLDTTIRLQIGSGDRMRPVAVTIGTRPPGPSGS